MLDTHLRISTKGGTTSAYKAQLEQDEDGRWSAWIDELPGCAVWGYTQGEALAALQDATEAYIEDMIDAGEFC